MAEKPSFRSAFKRWRCLALGTIFPLARGIRYAFGDIQVLDCAC